MQHIPTQIADTLHLYFQLTLIYVQIGKIIKFLTVEVYIVSVLVHRNVGWVVALSKYKV